MNRLCLRLSWSVQSAAALVLLLFGLGHAYAQKDPLPSWNNGPAKQAILKFVKDTTDKASASYVAPPNQSYYYCDNPQGYYPSVQSCSTPWREVPARK